MRNSSAAAPAAETPAVPSCGRVCSGRGHLRRGLAGPSGGTGSSQVPHPATENTGGAGRGTRFAPGRTSAKGAGRTAGNGNGHEGAAGRD